MIGDLTIFNISIIAKGVPFQTKLARKRKTAQLTWKTERLFTKFKSPKDIISCCQYVKRCFKAILQPFEE